MKPGFCCLTAVGRCLREAKGRSCTLCAARHDGAEPFLKVRVGTMVAVPRMHCLCVCKRSCRAPIKAFLSCRCISARLFYSRLMEVGLSKAELCAIA